MTMDKTFDARSVEPRIVALWEEAGAFRTGANAGPDAAPFTILLPPPNVTGSLHMGHAFNHTLMDILTRWHRMQGHDTLWQPGLDHAGIATQMVVERELAKRGEPGRREVGRDAFVRKVWEWKAQSGGTILDQCRRLGDSFDLSRNAFTMSGAPGAPPGEEGNFHDAVLRAFVTLYEQGLIFRGKRLVNWDPHFETAISDLEVEQVEQRGHLWRLRYPLENGATYQHPIAWDEDGTPTAHETRDYLVVATTRPETMLGDTGIAVHPDDPRYKHLVGRTVRLPLVGRSIPIVADEYADPEKGTGAVKITPAHDFNDWEVGQRAGLRAINVMDARARIALQGNRDFWKGAHPHDALTDLDGLDRYEARELVVTLATEGGWLDGIDEETHTVPHGDRSKVAVEPFLTDQWFVDAKTLAEPALAAVRDGRTRILPEQHEKTYFHWLENIEPWCISRQLWWGHRIPVWYGLKRFDEGGTRAWGDFNRTDDREIIVAPSEEEAIAIARQRYGTLVRVAEIHKEADHQRELDASINAELNGEPWREPIWRDPDVLDTWFSSGIWPIGTLGWPADTPEFRRYYPTSVLVTGFDILFFWVARMMMMQLALVGDVPFRDVYIHALVRDEKGKKMSKSLGNVLDPLDLIDEYGADSVRFTLASMAAMGRDLKLSRDRIAGYRNFGTKLWNAARFAEINECRPDPAFDPRAVTLTANKWIVGETGRLRETLDAALANYRFNDAAGSLYAHVWGKVCDWYVELAKPLFADPAKAPETRATMAWVLDQCLILLHPFMPFITEALWSHHPREKLLAHADWPAYGPELVARDADAEMGFVIALIDEIRSARAQMHVPAGARVTLIALETTPAQAWALETNRPLIARLARIEHFETADEAPRGAVTLTVRGAALCLPLADVIDIAAERERLARATEKLEKEANGLRAKLANEAFVAKAPEEVVDEARTRLEAAEEEIAILRAAQERLAVL